MKKYISGLLLPLIMAGCGSTSTEIGSGTYVDSAVAGVKYVCGNQQGTTDSLGTFTFEVNKGCRFFVDDIEFRIVKNTDLVNGVVLQEKNINIARFLQTLDNDANPGNGITITEEVSKVVVNVPANDAEFQTLNTLLGSIATYEGRAVSIAQAKAHLSDNGVVFLKVDATVSPASIKVNESVTFDASGSTGVSSYEWKEGNTVLGTGANFSKSYTTLGSHTVTLTVTDADGNQDTQDVAFVVKSLADATIWDNVNATSTNGNNKLFITSDTDNLYIKLESDQNISNVKLFINSDNSRLSGLQTSTWNQDGFDYALSGTEAFKLQHAGDFSGIAVEGMLSVSGNVFTIDKSKFEYLADKISVVAFFGLDNPNNTPLMGAVNSYTDADYNAAQVDTVAPVFTVNQAVVTVDGNYTKPSATAFDIFDNRAITVSSDDTDVMPTTPGYYTVQHTATDSAGNVARDSTIVHVLGESGQTTLQLKNMGVFNDAVAINHQTGLVWSNDNRDEAETRGCIIFGTDTGVSNIQTSFTNYCENSTYAGLDHWEAPTALELSKFHVQMAQENHEPGMARKNCSRIIGLDGTTVSAVWTHKIELNGNTNYTGYTETLSGMTTPPAGGRCVRRSKGIDTSTGTFTSTTGGLGEAKVVADSATGLTWVNEFNKNNEACLAIHFTVPEEYTTSKTFCGDLNYAGVDTWRDPTASELSNYIAKTNAAHIFIGYEAPCTRLLSRESNGAESAVSSRFDGSKAVGTVSDLEQNLTSNIGLRCVHD